MKIGILGAMDQEVALLQASLDNPEVVEWKHLTFYTGSLHGVEVVVVKCGIGKVVWCWEWKWYMSRMIMR